MDVRLKDLTFTLKKLNPFEERVSIRDSERVKCWDLLWPKNHPCEPNSAGISEIITWATSLHDTVGKSNRSDQSGMLLLRGGFEGENGWGKVNGSSDRVMCGKKLYKEASVGRIRMMVGKCLNRMRRRKMMGKKMGGRGTGAVLALEMVIDSIMVRKAGKCGTRWLAEAGQPRKMGKLLRDVTF
ncbi:unnamed protein product [Sphenostylis stenocarpa]|uniref:Uncharacterized protein n=1 Tax=Sphenostylis stenocarpa TaxID=92480 RepID=A0AA86SQD0_9FABA|nr:unnamed protein product [Sphenostylis stenocarpa]